MIETVYSLKTIEKRPYLAFLMGLAFCIIGVALAAIFFRNDPALVSVAFIAILLYPTIRKLLQQEKDILLNDKKWKDLFLVRMHRKVIMLYIFVFLGVLLGYSLFSLILPSLATNVLFEKQIE